MGFKNANTKNQTKNKGEKKGKDNLKSDHSTCHDEVIHDPRFSRVHTDPRFQEARKRETKVAIDSRFYCMTTQKNFLPCSAPIDKRGKPKDKLTSQLYSLRHYYKIDVEDKKKVEDSCDEDKEEEEEEEEGLMEENDKGAHSEETNESESATDTDTDTDEGVDEKVYEEEGPAMQEEVAKIEKETYRLAAVNMDWRFVKADDLYVLFNSFVPPNGMIKSVAIYPTEFGLQRMKEEEIHGPVGLFDDENEKSDDEGSDDDDIDNEKLCAYEKSRMRTEISVVNKVLVPCTLCLMKITLPKTRGTITLTAAHIYKECDDYGVLASSNQLDLRFIPDNMEFKQPPRDVATEAPAPESYVHKDFCSQALQHSKVDLTWDEDEPLRAKALQREFNDEQLAQFNDFLTSVVSESDSGEDNNETDDQPDKKARQRDKHRPLLSSGSGSDEDAEHGNVQDMEVTFNPGLGDISKHILQKKDEKSEKAHLRKRREKKKARKNKSKYSSDDDDDDDDDDSTNDTDQEATEEADDFFIEEPAVKKRKKAQTKNDKDHKLQDIDVVDKATKEELELLLADDKGTDTGVKGYNLKFKKAKGKKRENAIDEGKIPNSVFDDPRFTALFSHDYAIDPANPQFKRSAAYARQLAQKQQKGDMLDDSGMMQKGEEEGLDVLKSKRDKYELSSLVKSIKMKSKQLQLSSDGKTGKDGKSQFKGMEKKRR